MWHHQVYDIIELWNGLITKGFFSHSNLENMPVILLSLEYPTILSFIWMPFECPVFRSPLNAVIFSAMQLVEEEGAEEPGLIHDDDLPKVRRPHLCELCGKSYSALPGILKSGFISWQNLYGKWPLWVNEIKKKRLETFIKLCFKLLFTKLRQITRPRLAIQKIFDIQPLFGVE